jgi:hypothetical protein
MTGVVMGSDAVSGGARRDLPATSSANLWHCISGLPGHGATGRIRPGPDSLAPAGDAMVAAAGPARVAVQRSARFVTHHRQTPTSRMYPAVGNRCAITRCVAICDSRNIW